MKYKLSLIIPSVHYDQWTRLYSEMTQACKTHTFEMIFVGPHSDPQALALENVKFVKDFGSPARCFQIGSLIAEGEFIALAVDDAQIMPNAFDIVFQQIEDINIQDDVINLLYSEGGGNQHLNPNYWLAHTHDDLRKPGVREGWKACGVFMYRLDTWYKFGGLDCSFEHINMNIHDLAFTIQANGGRAINSSIMVYNVGWVPWNNENKSAVQLAWEQNDKPRFEQLYSDTDYTLKRNIDINNWKNQPTVWQRKRI